MYNPYDDNDLLLPNEPEVPETPEAPNVLPYAPAPEPQKAPEWPPVQESVQEQPVYAVPVHTTKKKKKKKGLGGKIVALALCCSLLGGAIGAGAVVLINKSTGGKIGSSKENVSVLLGKRRDAVINTTSVDTKKILTPTQIYQANVNSTVGITTQITTNYWGYQTSSAASGSGFIYSADGYVLTNYHVIQNANSVTVSTYNDEKYEATIVGYDESNDIAVLKIDAQDLVPVIMGDSDDLMVGDTVVAIGNPLGELTFSLTSGVVSALNRDVTMSSGITMKLIQTDCAINSGNSGGPLFNLHGEVVGIANAKYSSSGEASIDNICFAIPFRSVESIVNSIIEKGYVTKPYIGISADDVSEEALAFGIPKGAVVTYVEEEGPADKAGLQVNDIITAMNGNPISGRDAIIEAIGHTDPGTKVSLTIYRQGKELDVTVTVDEKIQEALPQEEEQQQQQQQQQLNPYGGYQQQVPFDPFDPFSFFGY